MRKLIFALVAAGVVTFSVFGYSSEDSTVTSRPDLNIKPGLTIDEDVVKSDPNPNKPGRTVDEDTVKSDPQPNKPGRTLEQTN